jgi:hypothetical protein
LKALKGLEQPEYIHVLINPLPVYGLAMGLIGLMIGLVLRSREARIGPVYPPVTGFSSPQIPTEESLNFPDGYQNGFEAEIRDLAAL